MDSGALTPLEATLKLASVGLSIGVIVHFLVGHGDTGLAKGDSNLLVKAPAPHSGLRNAARATWRPPTGAARRTR